MLEKSQHLKTELSEADAVIYRFKCKPCGRIYNDFDEYVKHVKKTRHKGVILTVVDGCEIMILL